MIDYLFTGDVSSDYNDKNNWCVKGESMKILDKNIKVVKASKKGKVVVEMSRRNFDVIVLACQVAKERYRHGKLNPPSGDNIDSAFEWNNSIRRCNNTEKTFTDYIDKKGK